MKALENMVVLDLTRAIAGPFCTLYLADMGARVIKIENPADPDFIRTYQPIIGQGEDEMSCCFAQYNRGKQAMTLNLGTPEGQEVFKELVKQADVVVENYKPGVMKKFGLNYEVLHEINPKLVYTALSGYGQTGPYAKRPAFDSCAQALSGIWSVNGYPGKPVKVGTILSDLVAGLHGVIGTLAAYSNALQTGKGQMVDEAMLDATFAITGYAVPIYSVSQTDPQPIGNLDTNARPFEDFACKDGTVFFGGFSDKFFSILCDYFGHPEFAKDPRYDTQAKRFVDDVYFPEIRPVLREWFASVSVAQIMADLGEKVPLAPVQTIGQAIRDPQIQHRKMMVTTQYPGGEMSLFGSPICLSETPTDATGLAPKVGQDNNLYTDLFGLDAARVQALIEKGVI